MDVWSRFGWKTSKLGTLSKTKAVFVQLIHGRGDRDVIGCLRVFQLISRLLFVRCLHGDRLRFLQTSRDLQTVFTAQNQTGSVAARARRSLNNAKMRKKKQLRDFSWTSIIWCVGKTCQIVCLRVCVCVRACEEPFYLCVCRLASSRARLPTMRAVHRCC